jgi:hypothetical protein
MTLVTIWLDDIDEWSILALSVGFDDQPLYSGPRRFSTRGDAIFNKLTAISGVSVYKPSVNVRRELSRYVDGGFAPDVSRLMRQIAEMLGACALGDFKIQYFVSNRVLSLVGPDADTTWPTGPGEFLRT